LPLPISYDVFPNRKAIMKRRSFWSAKEMMNATTVALTEFAGKGLQECFQQCYGHWQQHVTVERKYPEMVCSKTATKTCKHTQPKGSRIP
jgi:hypothetical protein